VEIAPEIGARRVIDALKEAGVLSKDTHETVVRLAPPLTISRKALGTALERLVRVLTELER
jgi:ornithine--oxo-acid transaminase